jgi:hypothetical protein
MKVSRNCNEIHRFCFWNLLLSFLALHRRDVYWQPYAEMNDSQMKSGTSTWQSLRHLLASYAQRLSCHLTNLPKSVAWPVLEEPRLGLQERYREEVIQAKRFSFLVGLTPLSVASYQPHSNQRENHNLPPRNRTQTNERSNERNNTTTSSLLSSRSCYTYRPSPYHSSYTDLVSGHA